MQNLYTYFIRTIRWNAFDSLLTQGLLVAHHCAVRYYLGAEFHGEFGTALALMYSALVVINWGLDSSLSIVFSYIAKSQAHARTIFRQSIFPQIFIILLFGISLVLAGKHTLYVIIAAILITESIKKSCKVLLQLALHTQITALTEITGMVTYLMVVWSWYYTGNGMTLVSAFTALLCVSFLQLITLAVAVCSWYRLLPSVDIPEVTWTWRIAKSRLFVGSNQVIAQFFSANFLVPFFALSCGFAYASFFKIVSSAALWVTLIGQKIFGVSGAAILARTKELSLETKRAIFIAMTHRLYQVLYILIIFVVINGTTLFVTQCSSYAPRALVIGLTMLILSFLESFFVLYDRWYIIEERAYFLLFFNILSCLLLYSIMHNFLCFSDIGIVISMIIVRAMAIISLTLFSFYYWRLRPSLRLEKESVGIALLLSLLGYILLACTGFNS